MKIAVSVLDCDDKLEGVKKLNRAAINYIHVDVMDGEFVARKCFVNMNEVREISEVSECPLDVHLMVKEPNLYIEKLGNLDIAFVTIHLEIKEDLNCIIDNIHKMGYKAGISIKPDTNIEDLVPYLAVVDMILVMSVEPGMGGQKFIESTVERIEEITNLIAESGRDILIEVDGGINDVTVKKIADVDIAVVGSYVVKSDDYKGRVEKLLTDY